MSLSPAWRYLASLASGLPFDAFERYVEELVRWNAAIRLVGPRDLEGVRTQVADALAPFLLSPPALPLLDIGTGAGLPGVPVSLWLFSSHPPAGAHERVLLLEPQGKRVTFLRHAVRLLALPSTHVLQARAEEAAHLPLVAGTFSTVTARAVAEIPQALELARPFLTSGGTVFLPRGDERPSDAPGWVLDVAAAYEGPPGVGGRCYQRYRLPRP